MALVDSLIAFVVGLLIGALGIYVGARVLADVDDYTYALVTAFVATLIWIVVAFFVGWIPLLGPILALLAYVAVLNWRYPGGWMRAAGIALLAWVASLLVLYVLAVFEITTFQAVGVPGA